MLSLRLLHAVELEKRIRDAAGPAGEAEAARAVKDAGNLVQGESRKSFLPSSSGPNPATGANTLRWQTGGLARSILSRVSGSGFSTQARVGPTLVYGAIHETGGRTKAHVIKARKAGGALAFAHKGANVVVKSVQHPGSLIPARPYMRPALERAMPRIESIFRSIYSGLLAETPA